jgi:hypothetical protein
MFGICWHYSPFHILLGLIIAYGTKKRPVMAPTHDYHRNKIVTTPEKDLLQNMQDLSNGLHGCRIFSNIDLVKGYYQIPVAAKDIPKLLLLSHLALLNICSLLLGCPTTHKLSNA